MKILQRGGHGVDIALKSRYSPGPDTVFWSPKTEKQNGFNSFVLVANPDGPWATKDGTRVTLASINGIGEIRWTVERNGDHGEGAVEHFGLTAVPE